MAKYKRTEIGQILKGQDGKPDYMRLNTNDFCKKVLSKALTTANDKGLLFNLETKASQTANLQKAVESGKLKQEDADQIRERVAKIPDYVRFTVVLSEKL